MELSLMGNTYGQIKDNLPFQGAFPIIWSSRGVASGLN